MRVIGKSWGWLWDEKHFDSTLGSSSMVICTLPLTDSKTNIVSCCLVDCTCTVTSLRDTAVELWKAPGPNSYALGNKTQHQVLSKTYCTLEKTARGCTFYQMFHKMAFFVCRGQKKPQQLLLLHWIYCSCYSNNTHTSMRFSVPVIAYSGHQCTDKCQ